MAKRIQILPAQLIDQIAAGEVVERPASVVKELLENALDAGAKRVVCRVEDGGRRLVRVTDDGAGMSRDDLALSVVRHATSKIRSLEDLQSISSLGFRGEALPSIAAVSRLRITSRRREDQAGSRLTTEGGATPALDDVGAPSGTDVEVRDLFFNTPARRKFLRSAPTEMGHVNAWMTHLGLSHPEVHLRLEHNGRKVLDAPPNGDLAQRVAALLGREAFEHLHPVARRDPGFAVDGLVSDPGYSRNNTRGIHLFINGRFVRDRLLQYAVMEGYRTVLPEGRYPLVVLQLTIDPEQVDVNVHPQKTEVRFANVGRVQRGLAGAIAGSLSRSPWLDVGGATADAPAARRYSLRREPDRPVPAEAEARAARIREAMGRYQRGQPGRTPGASRPFAAVATAADAHGAADETGRSSARSLADWPIVGTLWNTYVALSLADRLVLVDQHAAHERITFERLRTSLDAAGVRSQRLLVPVQIEVEPALAAVVESEAERLLQMGFDIAPFGPSVVSVKAVPALLSEAPVVELVRDVLDEMAERDRAGSWEQHRLSVLGRMACHGSIRAGRALGEREIRSLLEQLDRVDFAGLCPHGRPVLVELGRSEVARWFHRG